jgi:osmoprotectant transport system ATP-binding protein
VSSTDDVSSENFIVIKVENVSKSHDGGQSFAVKDISFVVPQGHTLAIVGSSGSGKSTILKTINRLVEPTSGLVFVGGENVANIDPVLLRRRIGYVFQEIGLFPHMNVEENICIVPKLLGWNAEKRRARGEELMTLVGLPPETFRYRLPSELSGGQQQRVGVARALAVDPDYLLMDEPFGAVDALTRETLQEEVKRIQKQINKTIVFVTHDIFEALAIGDSIGVMHEGRLEQIGTPSELLQKPKTEFVHNLFARPARQLAQYGSVLQE